MDTSGGHQLQRPLEASGDTSGGSQRGEPAGSAVGGHQLQRPLEASVGEPAGGQRGEPAGDSEVPLNSQFILREIIVELDGFVFGEIFGRHGAGARRMFLKRFV